MNDSSSKIESDRQLLQEAHAKGFGATLGAYFKLSGPGWLQSAITLGGGSLGSSLYLGVLGGFALLWVQPAAMTLGIIMLSAIGYVTLSTGERPFRAINEHVNPVLGWGWALAVAAANIVWCLPQYSLANGVLSQNILPGLLGNEGAIVSAAQSALGTDGGAGAWIGVNANKLCVAITIFVLATIVTWSYDRGGWGIRLYETTLKIIVALIVLCFLGVVVRLSLSQEVALDWGAVFAGLAPDFNLFSQPVAKFTPLLDEIGSADSPARRFWSGQIVNMQRDVMIAAAATAVGINMTFLFAYSLIRKGWTKEFRGMATFDLASTLR